MHNLYYKGRIETVQKYGTSGYNPNRKAKPGTVDNPLNLTVKTQARADEVNTILIENNLVGNISIDESAAENILDLTGFLNKPKPQTAAIKHDRNAPCFCGSGKKHKKCCA
ncbi:PBPRA1643 family SWIM/SEC-C metal-binding motif protein [Algibacillus agarilyticus]|uniref:PBPRA1643 family SWIM/SEC-C metal-binding motif protein n=1 Tax=Algibacillus agarilyticus TaxID=2234133 RepID=UPI000DCF98D7|nr:PBPRA1643 family SWIM/SEC-C metal-binding motif protein [Algibacillus agarilyticus]